MNLLILNAFHPSGYNVAQSLRECAAKIVITHDARLPPRLSRSRFFDAVYSTELPKESWLRGLVSIEPDTKELSYVHQIMEICHIERIDLIIPINDIDIYLLSRHRPILLSRGLTLLAPLFSAYIQLTDKHRVMELAAGVGIPTPKSFRCDTRGDIDEAIQQLGFPLVLKATFSQGGSAVHIIHDHESLEVNLRRFEFLRRTPILQEYIFGTNETSFHILVSPQYDILTSFTLRKLRHLGPSFSTAIEVITSKAHPVVPG
jgi:carbamoylphosphate synthase large subunit